MNKSLRFTSHIADIITIPFFVILIFYFYGNQHKTTIEWILYLFGILGFFGYTIFTFLFLKRHQYI